jgi:tripartite-type tricarboxylate transporter receptor subunit TctC
VIKSESVDKPKEDILMKKTASFFCALFVLALFPVAAFSQGIDVKTKLKSMKPKDYPNQPIEFVVSFPAGGGMDVTARILAKYVENYIDGRIIVVNKPGGGGFVGNTYLSTQAKNDGYTVGIISTGILTDDLLKAKGAWSYKNSESLAFINEDPVTWIVSTSGPLKDKSLKDIIEISKQKPETLKVSVIPDAYFQWLTESVELYTGGKYIIVPFQGGVPGITSMLGGHVDFSSGYLTEYKGFLEAGKVNVIAQTGSVRSSFLPNVPTFNEVMKRDDILWSVGRFAAVPKGTPKDYMNYLAMAIDAALHDPECIADYDKAGIKIGAKYMNGKQTDAELDKIYKNYQDFFIKTKRLSQ